MKDLLLVRFTIGDAGYLGNRIYWYTGECIVNGPYLFNGTLDVSDAVPVDKVNACLIHDNWMTTYYGGEHWVMTFVRMDGEASR